MDDESKVPWIGVDPRGPVTHADKGDEWGRSFPEWACVSLEKGTRLQPDWLDARLGESSRRRHGWACFAKSIPNDRLHRVDDECLVGDGHFSGGDFRSDEVF